MNTYHTSVLLQETIELLHISAGKCYIDGTLGGGGHAFEILKRGGRVLGLDIDEEALSYVKEALQDGREKREFDPAAIVLVKANFKDMDAIARAYGFTNNAGIILDLGISSHHVTKPSRGFSFQLEGPLDMRMDTDLTVKAKDLVNALTKRELYDLFTKLGEDRNARSIAASIVETRQEKQIETTIELAQIIKKAVPYTKKGINPATKVFQALRIAVNDELNSLSAVLPQAVGLLEKGGRLGIISFHSLEDRIVKRAFLAFEKQGLGKIVTKKPVVPASQEIEANWRARSAKLRFFEKI